MPKSITPATPTSHDPAGAAATSAVDISVPDSQTLSSDTKNAKKFTVYKVLVTTAEKNYFIFRRYNEFHVLYDKLKKVHTDLHVKLPGKKLFGNNFDPEFINMRKDGLNDFVTKILTIENISSNPDIREFLQLDNPRNSDHSDQPDEEQAAAPATDAAPSGEEALADQFDNLAVGRTLNDKAKPGDFTFLKVIGKGSFGKVLLAKENKSSQYYAIKVLHKAAIRKRNEARHIMSERNVLLKNLKHPFLVGLHYSFQTHDKLYFVLDYVNGGELFFHLQKERFFPEQRARFYSAEIGSAIGYLHTESIIYRDLKPENILLDSKGHVVLTDFGLCKEGIENKGTTSTFCGTPEYLAPEVLKKEKYDKSVDWWCLGAVTYEMMYGLPPFYSRDTAEMYERILKQDLKLRTNISASARELLAALLQKDKTKRLGSGEGDFDDIREYRFYKEHIDFEALYQKKLKAPWCPNVSNPEDLRHFDPEFVREPVPQSVTKSNQIVASVDDTDDNAFVGFTYVPGNALDD